jgi:hypothetical protein
VLALHAVFLGQRVMTVVEAELSRIDKVLAQGSVFKLAPTTVPTVVSSFGCADVTEHPATRFQVPESLVASSLGAVNYLLTRRAQQSFNLYRLRFIFLCAGSNRSVKAVVASRLLLLVKAKSYKFVQPSLTFN